MNAPPLIAMPAEAVEAIARRVVELLREEALTTRHLVDAGTLATILDVDRSWVYEHASQLGAIRLGDGPRGRLRFDVDRALAAWQHEHQAAAAPVAAQPRRRASRRASGAPLLPIRTRRDAA